MTSKRYFLLVLILGTLSAIGPFSIDMYLPGFPGIAESLHTTVASVSLSLSSFFIGISAGGIACTYQDAIAENSTFIRQSIIRWNIFHFDPIVFYLCLGK